jgi:hypothetical protein
MAAPAEEDEGGSWQARATRSGQHTLLRETFVVMAVILPLYNEAQRNQDCGPGTFGQLAQPPGTSVCMVLVLDLPYCIRRHTAQFH